MISGATRSGTTWLGEILNYDNAHRLIFEPFLPESVQAAEEFAPYPYLPRTHRDPRRVERARAILTGQVFEPAFDRGNLRESATRRIVKDVRTNMLLPWLQEILPDMRIVLIVRHPFAVAASRYRMAWANRTPALLAQEKLIERYPIIAEVAGEIDEDCVFEHSILLWAALHYVPMREGLRQRNLHIVHYENLVIHPRTELGALFAKLDLAFEPRTLDLVQRRSRTETHRRDMRTRRERLRPISEYREILSHPQIDRGAEILRRFGLDGWYRDDGTPSGPAPLISSESIPR